MTEVIIRYLLRALREIIQKSVDSNWHVVRLCYITTIFGVCQNKRPTLVVSAVHNIIYQKTEDYPFCSKESPSSAN